MIKSILRKVRGGVTYVISGPEGLKRLHEMRVWKARLGGIPQRTPPVAGEKRTYSDKYKHLYTDFFGLDESFYSGKRILDIGCGPGGSLEWADMALERVGLDPLARDYRRECNTHNHKMQYVSAFAERIPFPDECFDVVSSLMSLKHIIGLEEAVNEVIRVTTRGGMFLLHTPINRPPNRREPTMITLDIIEKLRQRMELSTGYYAPKTRGIIGSWIPYDRLVDSSQRLSLKAIFVKV